jgi:hypothetical protein
MLEGLTLEEKVDAQNILDLLTGDKGLRTFLNVEEISRYMTITESAVQHIIGHLIKKKIVHAVVENDNVIGYELMHDFLSKKFFEKLEPEAQRAKTTIEIFRKAFKEWKLHGVLASKDRLEILLENIGQLSLNDEEWLFLIKSSFSIYWYYDNKWIKIIEKERLVNICMGLLSDDKEEVVKNSIRTLGKLRGDKISPVFKKIIESTKNSVSIRETAITQFWFDITDIRILNPLRKIIKNEENFKLRKAAVYAFGKNISNLRKPNKNIKDSELDVLYQAFNDSKSQVRKEAVDAIGNLPDNKKYVDPLIKRLNKEFSIPVRISLVRVLCSLFNKGHEIELIATLLKKIAMDTNTKEDYRVREEARGVIPPSIDRLSGHFLYT